MKVDTNSGLFFKDLSVCVLSTTITYAINYGVKKVIDSTTISINPRAIGHNAEMPDNVIIM